jgi:hypothetical protein
MLLLVACCASTSISHISNMGSLQYLELSYTPSSPQACAMANNLIIRWMKVADEGLSDLFTCQYMEYHSTIKINIFVSFFKELTRQRPLM